MIYYKKYSLIYWAILKNGTKVLEDLLKEYFGDEGINIGIANKITDINFIIPSTPNDKLLTAVNQYTIIRNPYDRLVSQFYHSQFIVDVFFFE